MQVLVIDGQGGGIGKALVEQLKRANPALVLTCVGTNALATSAMLRAGADAGATGENAVCVCARTAQCIVGPVGIVLADAMLGEITERMAAAIARSAAHKVLLPVARCQVQIAGTTEQPLAESIQDAVRIVCAYAREMGGES